MALPNDLDLLTEQTLQLAVVGRALDERSQQATRTLENVARECAQILGGACFVRGSKIERIYRDVRAHAIGGGSEEIMKDLAARQLGV